MTYLESLVLTAYLQALPRIASARYQAVLAHSEAWMMACIGDDDLQAFFVERMNAAVSDIEAHRRRTEARRTLGKDRS